MYDLVSEQDGHALGVHIRGEVTESALEELSAFLSDRTSNTDRLSVLFEVDDLSPDESEVLMSQFDLDLDGADAVVRVAVVGDELWERWTGALEEHFPQAEIQFYGGNHLAEAWAWVRGKV